MKNIKEMNVEELSQVHREITNQLNFLRYHISENQNLKTEEVKMFLFARWLATCYADEHLDSKMRYTDNIDFDRSTAMSVLNRESGYWYKEQLKEFNEVVYPNYLKNGTVDNCIKFFEEL